MKRTFKIFGLLFFLFVVYVSGQITYGTITDFKPEAIINLNPEQKAKQQTIEDSTLTFMIWNIGYGGLGAESDFFYADGGILLSGGQMVRPSKEIVEKNVKGILQTVNEYPVDFYLFQEVDYKSKRSYYIDQFNAMMSILPDYDAYKSVNYQVAYVPTPVLEPWNVYGPAYSGLGTFSKYQALQSTRYQLPGEFSWPNKVYLLDRCASQHRYPLLNDKELIVYNIHNSAYDKDGSIKKQQMDFLRQQWLAEYEKGNYLIIGGDWNQCPPHFRVNTFRPTQVANNSSYNINPDFLPPDWLWIYDPTVPTIRTTREVYDPKSTFISLIDYFLISPNVKALEVKGIDLNFEYSDHQPVKLKVELE